MMNRKFQESLKGFSEIRNSKLRKKATQKRWNIAHESEEHYWLNYTTESLKQESGDRYPKKAKILLKEWQEFKKINKKTKILQVGCGPEDVINYFEIGETYSVDPLADFYKKRFDFDYKKTNFIQAQGEKIPFPDRSFDIIILINVLDHTHLPNKVLSEIKRVLKDDGLFHFEVYVYQKRFIQLAKLWGKLKTIFTGKPFNIHHPYMFTPDDVRFLLSKKFKILKQHIVRDIELCNNLEELKQYMKSQKSLTKKLPAFLGLYGIINYTVICVKKI